MSKKIHNILLERSLEQHRSLNEIFRNNGVIFLKKSKKNLFAFMINLIISQQLSTKAANAIWKNVKELEKTKMLSLMEICSKKNSDILENCGLSKNKTKAAILLRESFKQNKINEDALSKMNESELSLFIQSLWGFGPWSAEIIAMFFYGMPDIWAKKDLILNRYIKLIAKLENESYENIIQVYSPFKTYLALHIWKANNSGLFKEI
tara:strand:- start:4823 stop:5443 length:621 start_codon:yes stop_codon:yes gene_type:complete